MVRGGLRGGCQGTGNSERGTGNREQGTEEWTLAAFADAYAASLANRNRTNGRIGGAGEGESRGCVGYAAAPLDGRRTDVVGARVGVRAALLGINLAKTQRTANIPARKEATSVAAALVPPDMLVADKTKQRAPGDAEFRHGLIDSNQIGRKILVDI